MHRHTDGMRQRIDSAEGRALYGRRIATVGPVLGNLRNNKRLDRFTLRGRRKVDTRWKLYCMVHDIEKLAHHGYLSAVALGINNRGFLAARRGWGQLHSAFAVKDALERCNAAGTEGSCRVVMINGEFQEQAFMDVAARLGPMNPYRVRIQHVVNDLPREIATGR